MKNTGFRLAIIFAMVIIVLPAGAALANGKNGGNFEIKGTIESLPAGPGFTGDWVVSGRTVHVTSSTSIEQEHGTVRVGASVEVKGNQRSDGSVDATRIEVNPTNGGDDDGDDNDEDIHFSGTVETFPAGLIGDWRVGGRIIHVSTSTHIEQEIGPIAVGAFVQIEGPGLSDGSINATEIEVKSNVGGNDGRHELKGRIEHLPDTPGFVGTWIVSGRSVNVISSTNIKQEEALVAVGTLVEVSGTLESDNSITASRIETKSSFDDSGNQNGDRAKFKGTVESRPGSGLIGDWIIGGRTVQVTASTRVKQQHGAATVGTRVKVKGVGQADGSVRADKLQVMDSN